MTTHQLASKLLSLPDTTVVIEGWCEMEGYEMDVHEQEDEDAVIIYQRCLDPEAYAKWVEENFTISKHGVEILIPQTLVDELMDDPKDYTCPRCDCAIDDLGLCGCDNV